MKTHSFSYQSQEDISDFINEWSESIDNACSVLIQVFTSIFDEKFIERLQAELNTFFPKAKIIGCTVKGEITLNHVIVSSTTVSVTVFEKSTVDVAIEYGNPKEANSFEAGSHLAQKLIKKDTKVLLIYADGLHMNGDDFLEGLASVSKDIIISGGLAGDNIDHTKTYTFTNTQIVDQMGAVAASIESKDLICRTEYTFDWEGIGTIMTVTQAKKNRIYSIENKTAYEAYEYYFGEDLAQALPEASIEFPLIVKKGDRGMAKIVLDTCPDGSLILGGNVQSGDYVQFGFANIEMILSSSYELAKRISTYPVESIFMYSCAIRQKFLYEGLSKEIKLFNAVAPVSGFFTYGEFFTYIDPKTKKNKYEFLNQSLTVLTLSENENIKEAALPKIERRQRNMKTLKALSNLIEATSWELLNSNNLLEQKQKKLKELNANLAARILEETKKIERQNQRLLEQSRLAQMGEMISMIAHQWRQPLAAIASTSSALSLKIALNKYDREIFSKSVTQISNYAQHLSKTIDDFRNFFRPNKEKDETTLEAIVESSLSIVQISLENKGIKLDKKYACNQPLMLYSNEVKQVVLNFVKNAEDILLEKEIQEPMIKIYTYCSDEGIFCLEVEDNAGGVPTKIIDKIFDPYFSTKKSKDGTGLGLYMSKTIIEEHCKGKLKVFNRGEGAVFKIEL
jgi:signal transduction histidine kinase